MHFLALWSQKPDAVPIVMSHGWPGSVLEFTPLLKHLTETYAPATLPYHVLVPSLIGYGWSSPPPLDRPFSSRDNAGIWDALMRGLGFSKDKGRGYLAQGGDIGSFVTRQLSQHESCLGECGEAWLVAHTPQGSTSTFTRCSSPRTSRWPTSTPWTSRP